MKTYRNLSYSLFILVVMSLALIIPFSYADINSISMTFLGVFIAVFAVSLVGLVASLCLYFSAKMNNVVVLKRRGSRVYSELLHHKALLIGALDGDKPIVDWPSYLYSSEEFIRLRAFLGEEYFLLLSCDSFFPNSEAAKAYNSFRPLHEQLSPFLRSITYDKVECQRFKSRYKNITGKELTNRVKDEVFTMDAGLREAYEALQMANEQALQTVEDLLDTIEKLEINLDKHYETAVNWPMIKKEIDARYNMWLNATSVDDLY